MTVFTIYQYSFAHEGDYEANVRNHSLSVNIFIIY